LTSLGKSPNLNAGRGAVAGGEHLMQLSEGQWLPVAQAAHQFNPWHR